MGLGVLGLWVGERNKNTEFGLGPWTAVRRKLVESWVWVLLTYESGTQAKPLNSGWVPGLQYEGRSLSHWDDRCWLMDRGNTWKH